MNRMIAAVAALGLTLPAVALAQTGKGKAPGSGQSEYAPGQQTGPAKDAAPGQLKKEKGTTPGEKGASEYAPGQQGKSGTGSTTGKRGK